MGLRLITSPQPSGGVHFQPVAIADEPVDEQSPEPSQLSHSPTKISSAGYAAGVRVGVGQEPAGRCGQQGATRATAGTVMNQQDANPLVYGYLCVDEPNENQVATWTREISAFANKSGYRLGSIFIDSGDIAKSLARGGFVELLTALRLPEAYAAVVPSLTHLSTDTFLQQVLVHMVQLTGSQLLVSSITNGGSSEIELATESGTES